MLGAANDALGVGVQLLRDLRQIFGTADKMRTDEILIKLAGLPESPWLKDHHNGSPLSSRDLSKLLRQYGVRSRDMKIDGGLTRVMSLTIWRTLGGATSRASESPQPSRPA